MYSSTPSQYEGGSDFTFGSGTKRQHEEEGTPAAATGEEKVAKKLKLEEEPTDKGCSPKKRKLEKEKKSKKKAKLSEEH